MLDRQRIETVPKAGVSLLALMLMLMLLVFPAQAFATDADGEEPSGEESAMTAASIASGTWGTCAWDISDEGVLTVHPGTGAYQLYGSSPWSDYKDSITSIVFAKEGGAKAVARFEIDALFAGLSKVTSIDASGLDVSQVTSMANLFDGCELLATLDTTGWDTSKVTNMSCAFRDCKYELEALDLSHWDVSSVTNMKRMFSNCSNLRFLNVANWKTSQVTDMSGLFYGCKEASTFDVKNWDTSSVTDMSYLFYFCPKLEYLDLSGWDTSKVTTMSYMFSNCVSLTYLDFPHWSWDTSSLWSTNFMFNWCSALTDLDLSGWNTSSLHLMERMFVNCTSLEELDLSNWNTYAVTNMAGAFQGCTSLKTIYASDDLNTSSISQYGQTFHDCASLVGGNGTKFGTSGAPDETAYSAKIDKPGQKGYLTLSSSKPQRSYITDANVSFSATGYTYDGNEKKPAVSVTYGGKTLVADRDYTVTYKRNVDAGSAAVLIKGMGSYRGLVMKPFAIKPAQLTKATAEPTSFEYDGWGHEPWRYTVKAGTLDVPEEGYTVACGKKVNVGKYTATITGVGNYTGSVKAPFEIKAKPVEPSYTLVDAPTAKTGLAYTGKAQTGVAAGEGYTVSGNTATNAGFYTAHATLKDGYEWSDGTFSAKDIEWEIAPVSLTSVTVSPTSYVYDGKEKKPAVTVKAGSRTVPASGYEVVYNNNVNAGTAEVYVTGKGNYDDRVWTTFTIKEAPAPVPQDPADKTKLETAIDKADGSPYTDAVVTSADGKDVPRDTQWVTPAAKSALEAARSEAWRVANYGLATQKQVDDACAALEKAMAAFVPKPGTKQEGEQVDPQPQPTGPATWTRLAGPGALDTMAAIIDAGKFAKGGTVVLASLEGYWDALTAAGIAGLEEAPVVMALQSELGTRSAETIRALAPEKIIVCGGGYWIPDSVVAEAKAAAGTSPEVVRLAGGNAAQTAGQIAAYGKGRWSDTAIVATAGTFQDALAAAPVSYAKGMPIFLAQFDFAKEEGYITADTIKAMKDAGVTQCYIAGGSYWLPAQVKADLEKAQIEVLDQLGGASAVETSGLIAQLATGKLGMSADNMGAANVDQHYDALASAAFCGKNNSVLVLVRDANRSVVDSFVKPNASKIGQGYVFGGTGSVSDASMAALQSATK